jgi:hypothetical protein
MVLIAELFIDLIDDETIGLDDNNSEEPTLFIYDELFLQP